MQIGRKIYFDVKTGNVIIDLGESQGDISPTTVDDDIAVFKPLSERNRESFDVIELEYGRYSQEFMECSSYRVNPETKEIEFSHPDPNAPEEPQPFQKPLTDQIVELEERQQLMQQALDELLLGGGL
jgi:hypothetical protein